MQMTWISGAQRYILSINLKHLDFHLYNAYTDWMNEFWSLSLFLFFLFFSFLSWWRNARHSCKPKIECEILLFWMRKMKMKCWFDCMDLESIHIYIYICMYGWLNVRCGWIMHRWLIRERANGVVAIKW